MNKNQKTPPKGVIIGMMIVIIFLSVSFIFFNAPSGFSSNSESGMSESKNNIVPVKIQDDPDFDAFITGSYKKGSSLVVELYHNSEAVQTIAVLGLDESEYSISKKESLKNEKVTLTIPYWNNRYFKLKVGHSSEVFEFGIKILNVQSYPTVGGNWTVMFNTTGKADLWITAVNGTEFNKDLIFLEVRCGDKILNYEFINNSILIENYECSETGYETSKVLTTGKHSLKFKFGSQTLNNLYYIAAQKND